MTGPRSRPDARTPEQSILLLCARTHQDDGDRARLRHLMDGAVDWSVVLDLAYRHGTVTLLNHHLRGLGADAGELVPPSVRGALNDRTMAATARSMMLVAELTSLLADMDAGGAPGVAWKGPVLAHSVYPSPELRIFLDLDLLVRRRDVLRARDILAQRGYTSRDGRPLTAEAAFGRPDDSVPVMHRDSRILVDLHWGASVRYFSSAMDTDALCDQSQPLRVGDTTIAALAPPAQLLALCAHGAKHGPFPWPKLKWVADVEACLRAYPGDEWNTILSRARAIGCQRMVLLGVLLARDLLDAPIPAAVEARLAGDRTVERLVPGICDRLLANDPAEFALTDRVRFDLAVRERWRDRTRYRAQRLVTTSPRDEEALRLPAALGFLRLPARLARLAAKYLRRPSGFRALF